MKSILAAFLAVAFLASTPAFAGDEKGEKADKSAKKEKKGDKKDEKAEKPAGGGGW